MSGLGLRLGLGSLALQTGALEIVLIPTFGVGALPRLLRTGFRVWRRRVNCLSLGVLALIAGFI